MTRALGWLSTKTKLGVAAARVFGVCKKTLARWLARIAAGVSVIKRRGGIMRAGSPEAECAVRNLVVDLRGLVGATSLSRSVDGVSRRRAAILKRDVLTDQERARKATASRVQITVPGVVRGFDAMYLSNGFALIAADAAVPLRTSAVLADAYTADNVAAVLDLDFRIHGAPLFLRLDNARCHTAPAVLSVLRAWSVILLQGPTYYAPYYGQLERQNAEHRAWCQWDCMTQSDLDRMKTAMNERWLRPTLGWRSAADHWNERPSLDDDRDELHDDVHERAGRLRFHDVDANLAMRLAIEQALTERGYLHITPGRTLLCE